MTATDPRVVEQEAAALPQGASGQKAVARKSIPQQVFAVLSSYGLSCIILLLLMVTTYFGTAAQKHMSLAQALDKYFHHLYFVEDIGAVGLRLPGAYVLLCLLFVNLVCGGLIRVRWSKRTRGILITHIGMVLLIFAGFVKFYWSTNGAIRFEAGEVAKTYHAFTDYELAITAQVGEGKTKEYLVPESALAARKTIRHAELPFSVEVQSWAPHVVPRKAGHAGGVDGIVFRSLPPPGPDQVSIPGAILLVRDKQGKEQRGLVWSREDHPWTVRVDGKPYTIGLRLAVFDLPFALRMEKFRREFHPHTRRPKHFSTDVTKIEDGVESDHHITMNAPMRYGGLTFSQNSWGPQDDPDGPWFSVLEVSTNPADQWPKYCCYIIALGMCWHFIDKLRRDMARRRRQEATT